MTPNTAVRRASRVMVGLTLVLCALGMDGARARLAEASPFTKGPKVTLDRDKVSLGESVRVTMSGFDTSYVVISVCGNEARRGSMDCNMVESDGRPLRRDGEPTIDVMPIAAPPMPCPCVIRAASRMNDQVATAPITIVGHPVGDVVEADDTAPLLVVSIAADAAPDGVTGWLKSSIGGDARYDITVTVKNQSTVPVSNLTIIASAGRDGNSDIAMPDFDQPGVIPPGQTWQQTLSATVPAPSLGSVRWRASVAGAGLAAQDTTSTRNVPLLLLVLITVLVIDLALLLMRFRIRLRMRRAEQNDTSRAGEQVIDVGVHDDSDDARQLVDSNA